MIEVLEESSFAEAEYRSIHELVAYDDDGMTVIREDVRLLFVASVCRQGRTYSVGTGRHAGNVNLFLSLRIVQVQALCALPLVLDISGRYAAC